MSRFSKRSLIIVSCLISFIIWISLNFILIKFEEGQKKDLNTNFILKTSRNDETNQNNNVQNNELEEEKEIVLNQYQSNEWRIFISKINLDAPILEGTGREILRRGVGHFEETSKWDGNVVLAAHNRGYKYNFFQEIKQLEIGDIIEYQTERGKRNYEVMKKTTIKETDLSCLKNTEENLLTLITCKEDMPEYRLCIQATLT